jgi:hypothetical protein
MNCCDDLIRMNSDRSRSTVTPMMTNQIAKNKFMSKNKLIGANVGNKFNNTDPGSINLGSLINRYQWTLDKLQWSLSKVGLIWRTMDESKSSCVWLFFLFVSIPQLTPNIIWRLGETLLCKKLDLFALFRLFITYSTIDHPTSIIFDERCFVWVSTLMAKTRENKHVDTWHAPRLPQKVDYLRGSNFRRRHVHSDQVTVTNARHVHTTHCVIWLKLIGIQPTLFRNMDYSHMYACPTVDGCIPPQTHIDVVRHAAIVGTNFVYTIIISIVIICEICCSMMPDKSHVCF